MEKACIICHELKNESDFNDEHVIPDSLGGYYHTYKVCKACNSELGHKVDSRLVNNFLSQVCRERLEIKGKSGNIPRPLTGTFTLSDDPTQKVKVKYEAGKLQPILITKVEDTPTGYKLSVDETHLNEAYAIIEKKNKKLGKLGKAVRTELKSQERTFPLLTNSFTIDFNGLQMGLLKIAYEFTIDEIPSYYEDETAIQISKILKTNDLTFPNIEFLTPVLLDKTQPALLENFIDIKDACKHYLFLYQFKNDALYCCVNLFDTYFLIIKMSEKMYFKALRIHPWN